MELELTSIVLGFAFGVWVTAILIGICAWGTEPKPRDKDYEWWDKD